MKPRTPTPWSSTPSGWCTARGPDLDVLCAAPEMDISVGATHTADELFAEDDRLFDEGLLGRYDGVDVILDFDWERNGVSVLANDLELAGPRIEAVREELEVRIAGVGVLDPEVAVIGVGSMPEGVLGSSPACITSGQFERTLLIEPTSVYYANFDVPYVPTGSS